MGGARCSTRKGRKTILWTGPVLASQAHKKQWKTNQNGTKQSVIIGARTTDKIKRLFKAKRCGILEANNVIVEAAGFNVNL